MCAIAASEKSPDTVWFLKIVKEGTATKTIFDEYGHSIIEGSSYVEGKYLEFETSKKNEKVYREMDKTVYYYVCSVVYPFVNTRFEKGKMYHITNNDFCDVISYVQHHGMQSL